MTPLAILFAGLFCIAFVGLMIADTKLQKSQAKLKFAQKKAEEGRQFKRDVRRLLWNLGNQREKVPGNLITVIRTMGDSIQYNSEETYEIKEKIMENIK